MNKISPIKYLIVAITGLLVLSFSSCKSEHEAPVIESVWSNSSAAPAEKVEFSYPEETICLHGHDFSDLQEVSVNGVAIDLMKTIMYDTDSFITFAIPTEVKSTKDCGKSVILIKTAHGTTTYEPFLIKSTSEKPTIISVSAKALTAGGTLEIKGTNLDGAFEAYLPLSFDQSVKCELDTENQSTSTSVFVTIPDHVNFATGKVKLVMNKKSEELDKEYTETVYSSKIDFTNK